MTNKKCDDGFQRVTTEENKERIEGKESEEGGISR
jgi:hypothetical protein